MAICVKLKDIIDEVKALKPENAYSDDQLTEFINEVEGMVQTEAFIFSVDQIFKYNYDTDADKELLVAFPHSKIYKSYLMAMIDFSNGEYEKYNNSMMLFNSHWSEFIKWFARNYRPADIKRRLGNGIL